MNQWTWLLYAQLREKRGKKSLKSGPHQEVHQIPQVKNKSPVKIHVLSESLFTLVLTS